MKKAQRIAVSVGVAVVAGLDSSIANADPMTVDLDELNLTYMNYHGTAPNAGANQLLLAPDSNLVIEGQNANNPAQVQDITTAGAAAVSASSTVSSNGDNESSALIGSGGTFAEQLSPGGLDVVAPLSAVDSGAAGDPVVVPSPGTLSLFATGLGALGLLGWRRKKKARAV